MAITYRTGVVAEGQGLMLFQFRKRGDFPAFLGPMLNQIQALETAFYDLIAGRQLATATGWALDQIGESVGETRGFNATDSEYRGLIYARIAINTSAGTPRDLYNIVSLMGASNVSVRDVYPAAVQISYTGDLAVSGAQLRGALESASAPIEIGIVEHAETEPFSFAGDPLGRGFGVGTLASAY